MIYSIKELFHDYLIENNSVSYLIPTYQRGYKWASTENGQVQKLLSDIFDEYRISENTEYFLNFITLKKNEGFLEVVDGQQRLTTLTILISVLSHFIVNSEKIAYKKLKYESREDFLSQFIYDDIKKLIDTKDWQQFLLINGENYNNQDVYYLFEATLCIYKFLVDKMGKIEIFYKYLINQIKIVAYLFDNEKTGEHLFINVNKGVELTEEELVKAYIILGVLEKKQKENKNVTTYDVNEERANLGRRWDNLARWSNNEDIRTFFNVPSSNEAGKLSWLLNLYLKRDLRALKGLFESIEYFQRTEKIDSTEIFSKLEELQLELEEWYSDPETHNLIGYLMHVKGEKINISSLKEDVSSIYLKTELKLNLRHKVKKILELALFDTEPTNTILDIDESNLPDYNYKNGYAAFNILLLLEVWRYINPKSVHSETLYNFKEIKNGKWSLEHIFPQSPTDFRDINFISQEDINFLFEFVQNDSFEKGLNEDSKIIWGQLKDAYEKKTIFSLEENIVKDQLIELIRSQFNALHRFGNLSLLTKSLNSSLSNGFFKSKRHKILQAISSGKFVPLHTYDVFSKLLNPNAQTLMFWSKGDIESVELHVKNQITEIYSFLN